MTTLYLDIETDNSPGYNGLDVFNGRIVTVQLLLPNGKTHIIKDPTQADMDKIKPALENSLIVGHNIKFDCKFLKHNSALPSAMCMTLILLRLHCQVGCMPPLSKEKS